MKFNIGNVYKFFSLIIRSKSVVQPFIFGLFKIYPKMFSLIPMRSDQIVGVNYYEMINSVHDFDCLDNNEKLSLENSAKTNLKRIIWFVPDWSNVWGGGHYTLFRFAHHIQKNKNVENIIFIYQNRRHINGAFLENDLRTAIPDCKIQVIVDSKLLPSCDVAIATTWQSAYFVKSFNAAREKFYFMQDYESLFYAGGTKAMQANLSYQFGFKGITGGTWLRSIYESYGNIATNYIFATDRNIFYPNKEMRSEVKKLFFYGRPSTERRAFELGIAVLKLVSEKHPAVEIIIAGLNGIESPNFKCTLMGNLPLAKTGDLYRSCDIGLAFSGTNLSYLPLELMACGCPVVTNNGPQSEWYCKDNINSLLSEPTPSAVFNNLNTLINDINLRAKIREGGIESTSKNTWDSEIEKVFQFITKNV